MEQPSVSEIIGPEGRELAIQDILRLSIPEQSLTQKTKVTLSVDRQMSEIQSIEGGNIGNSVEYSIKPEGLVAEAVLHVFYHTYQVVNRSSIAELQEKRDKMWQLVRRKPFERNGWVSFEIKRFGYFKMIMVGPKLNHVNQDQLAQEEQPASPEEPLTPFIPDVELYISTNTNFYHARSLVHEMNAIPRGKAFKSAFYRTLLRQITHKVLEIHDAGLIHDNLNPENICFSINQRKVVLTLTSTDPTGIQSRASNMKSLASIFVFVLRENRIPDFNQDLANDCSEEDLICEDPYLAINLINEVGRSLHTAADVLMHPFFWTKYKKIQFFVRVANKLCRRGGDAIGENMLDGLGEHIFPNEKWTDLLKVNLGERQLYARLGWDQPNEEAENVMKEKAESGARGERRRSTYHLIKCIRNRYVHKEEDGPLLRSLLEDEKFWSFFYRRFPKLLLLTHGVMKAQYGNDSDFKVFFNELEGESNLPVSPNEKYENASQLREKFSRLL